ncbi:MAG TPA: sigma-70 family RNA polymerase sigma factor [Longimicrobiales bacterium]
MDEAEFSAFYLATWDPLWRYVRRSTMDAAATDDIVQGAFVRLVGTRRDLRGDEARRYVYAIATNLLRDRARRDARERGTESVEPTAEQRDAIERIGLETVLAKLSERDRQILWLAHIDGYDRRSIAKILNLNVLSVGPLLFRARGRLRALLEVHEE